MGAVFTGPQQNQANLLSRFHDAIEAGELLMMIDVPKDRIEEIDDLVKKHHPEAEIEGTEPTIPAFP